ncbi:MAG: glycerol kinase GlpK [Steroidobacteraceae bacterium]
MGEAALVAIDQGTSSSRAIAFSTRGELLAIEQQSFGQIYPASGWVEHDPEVLWATVLSTLRALLEQLRGLGHQVLAVGLTNQRETALVWNRRTGAPLHNAIVWQDRRTARLCADLARAGHEAEVADKTGLRLDPYFTSTKLAWILDHVPGARAAAQAGELAFGTVDSFLIWRLTGGALHVTDASNASRTALYDINRDAWDQGLCELFRVPHRCLPEVRDSAGDFGSTAVELLGEALPIRGVAGDQQAALIGQGCIVEGAAKSTFGTGAFLVLNTGTRRLRSHSQLLGTIAYRIAGRTTYALEGSILSAGSTIQWLRDGLGLFTRTEELEALAASVPDTGGVFVVPAFTGLGAPYWDPDARAGILGLNRATGRAELARAGLDSVVYQTRDLLDAMAADGVAPALLKVDGGMARNGLFLQRLADVLAVPILRPRTAESSAFGAACLAGLGAGVYCSLQEVAELWQADLRCLPTLDAAERERQIAGWRAAVKRVRSG